MLKKYRYDCTNPDSQTELECIIANSRAIPYSVFIKKVEKKFIEKFNKEIGIPELKDEQFASFYKSVTLRGKEVFFFQHSAIEYIFY